MGCCCGSARNLAVPTALRGGIGHCPKLMAIGLSGAGTNRRASEQVTLREITAAALEAGGFRVLLLVLLCCSLAETGILNYL